MEIFILIVIIIFGGGIAIILKKGFNEIVSGLESLDERLERIKRNVINNEAKFVNTFILS